MTPTKQQVDKALRTLKRELESPQMARAMSKILDTVFTPDVRIIHNELGEVIWGEALTDAGREYMRENVLLRGMSIESLNFPNLCVEYLDITELE